MNINMINLARMIKVYTRKFLTTDPREAIQYMFLLRGMKGVKINHVYIHVFTAFIVLGDGEDLFVKSLAEMVWESREYEVTFLNNSGC